MKRYLKPSATVITVATDDVILASIPVTIYDGLIQIRK